MLAEIAELFKVPLFYFFPGSAIGEPNDGAGRIRGRI
jgi:hypothetical protein